MHPLRLLVAPLLLSALLTAPAALGAQIGVTTDILSGRVTGGDGAALAGARIEARSLETGVTRTAVTRADGRYTLVFPDGGGRYELHASTLGRAPAAVLVVREADEDVLVADFRLEERAIVLDALEVRGARTPPPGRGEAGAQERYLSGDAVNRLPLEDNDPARLAALSPGVVAVGDSLDGRGGFSVAGQRESLNQVTLDGASFASVLGGGQAGGGSPLGVPQEGMRGTQVVTSTFDVSRGQFAGGLVAMTTRAGTNRTGGSFSWLLRDPLLQADAGSPQRSGYTQNRLSGGIGGPIVRDRLFYFGSASFQRRTDALYALEPRDPLAAAALGVSPDSVARFLDVLSSNHGLTGRSGAYTRTGDAVSLLGRMDWVATQRHNVALRGHLGLYGQDNARIGFLETMENGGEVATRGGGGIVTVTSRLGGAWINELRASANLDRRDQTPYEEVPEGRVRVSSVLPDGARGVSTLVFGGERSMPTYSRERTLEVSNELSFLFHDRHRIKLGGLVNHASFEQDATGNRLGTFEYDSLGAFADGMPSRYTRTLAPRTREGGGLNAALYLGDTWRPRTRVQVTYGVRLEGSRFDRAPDANPRVEALFGHLTDRLPSDVRLSPRAGFSWRLNEAGAPLRMVRGGVGEFRGRAPFSLFASALDQTGLQDGESILVCIGDAVPVPDWGAYARDPGAIPSACAGGLPGQPIANRRPNVTVFADDFAAPRSWRATLGYQTQLVRLVSASVDVTRTWGVGLFGVEDLNLAAEPAFVLADEGGRPVYVPASAITPAGQISELHSRREDEFAHVFRVHSGLRSETTQLTVGVRGMLPPRLMLQTSYTYSRSRDQSSFSGGSALWGFARVPTGGDPNARTWATSDLERRHSVNAILGVQLHRAVETSLIGRLSSGTPFTPMVGRDVNGDGVRNDAAFVFDPATAPDPEVAEGMRRLLDGADGRVRACIESQMGRIAERNACRGPMGYSLDVRSTIRPQGRTLGRRLSISVDAYNVAAGVDRLLHGADGVRGWGQSAFGRVDDVLLHPRGFDHAAGRFRYEVNERFGDRRSVGRAGFGSPFQLQLSARLNVGAQQGGGMAGMAGLAGGRGGMRGGPGGGRGGAGMRPGGPGAEDGRGFDADAILDRVLPEPVGAIVALRDTLGLSDEQVERLEAISDTLKARNAPIREKLRGEFAGAERTGGMGEVFGRIGPDLNRGREHVQAAMAEAREVLTPEQWRQVPPAIRNALSGVRGVGGEGRPRGGGRPRP
jgi:hypothetical protein